MICELALWGKSLGEFNIPSSTAREIGMWNSTAYFCRECGQIWGRCVTSLAEKWETLYASCPAHRDAWSISGAFTSGSRLALLPYLPAEILRWEFQQHMEYYS